MRKLHRFPGGLKLPANKEISSAQPTLPPIIPQQLIFQLDQHIGTPSVPVVKVGDQVLKGQLIATSSSYVSTSIHASSSGTVSAIDEVSITIKTDGADRWGEKMSAMDYTRSSNEELEKRIIDAGIIGMGGAGFPSHVKVIEGADAQVEMLIINGVECEPYISCDDRLLRERAQEVSAGAKILQKIVAADTCVLATESDMPEAYDALLKAAVEGQEVVLVPAIYPAGGEKQLIQMITGKWVSSLPIQDGILVQNVATVAAIYRAVVHGEPLISRIVTITGDVEQPCNIEVLNGTLVSELLAEVVKNTSEINKILMGGPMMGIEVRSDHSTVTKKTSSLLIRKNQIQEVESPCIRCGDCVDVCPMNLQPQMLFSLARGGQWDELEDYRLFECIECACCDYVCPSRIPLAGHFRQAKSEIQVRDKKVQRAVSNKDRFQQRLAREEVEQREARTKKKTDQLKKDNLQSEILAAISRSKARRKKTERPD